MIVLSNKQILQYRALGAIVIEPFNEQNVNTSSYDVTLGNWYFREQNPRETKKVVYNIYNEQDVNLVWGLAQDAFRDKTNAIVLAPGETILAHTNEFIGGYKQVTTMMKARSSYGRNFIEVCKCAGFGDVGYFNRWTMEITNNSKYYYIPLYVGCRIAQIVFMETGELIDKNKTYSSYGKYQVEKDLDRLKQTWHPYMMLPKLYNDKEIVEQTLPIFGENK